MYVSHLSLLDFRSYAAADVELEPGPTAFVGRNGQGKTNLVEAIGYVATLGSHRVANDTPLIRAGAERAVVRTRIVRGDRASTVELEITAGKANRARVNRGQAGRARDVLGILRTVLFAPEDLALVKGDPDGRRRFLDQLVVQLRPRAAGLLSDYERVVRQRSALLKSLRGVQRGGRTPDLSTLEVWDAKAAQLGAQILAMRLALTAALQPEVEAAYAQVSDADGRAELTYRSSVPEADGGAPSGLTGAGAMTPTAAELEPAMLEAISRVRGQEVERGVSLVGPHRDDLVLTLGDLPAKGYASHGESWSIALALRLASYRLLGGGADQASPAVDGLGTGGLGTDGETAGAPPAEATVVVPEGAFWDPDLGTDADPVLILDDVFAELDVRRRSRLADLVAPARQVLVTAAVPGDVPESLLGARFEVTPGQVRRA
ncbi:DNA replication/repair protein RecF [Isoptericola sp. NEAU-Y5]|uniref:DNA replication and repair protein RecF n=1 Tax=Isoptericola luteus TaxID=2879484 RepID=A0ABS7ZGI4_9MICO|nr:DNA replication/repair protein RecF [Isoptericola sp. NEAU-Y5]MCA5894128.1 DNA replication/repair protein RecF [Isoptericola sp. NEAU-Y5]